MNQFSIDIGSDHTETINMIHVYKGPMIHSTSPHRLTLKIFYSLDMCENFVCMYACTLCKLGAYRNWKRASSGPLEQEDGCL